MALPSAQPGCRTPVVYYAKDFFQEASPNSKQTPIHPFSRCKEADTGRWDEEGWARETDPGMWVSGAEEAWQTAESHHKQSATSAAVIHSP